MTVRFKRTRARRPCLKAIRTIVVEAAKDNRWGHRDSRRLEREAAESPFVFVSERGAPFSIRGLQAMVERVAQAAGFDIKTHPHMLRHACGYKLANEGIDTRTIQGYLGHKSIQHTVRYTELAPTRFRAFGETEVEA